MNFLPGNKLLHFKKYPHAVRQKIAKNMFTAWYYPFYKYGVIHGDPHLGNYSSDKNANINLLKCFQIPNFHMHVWLNQCHCF